MIKHIKKYLGASESDPRNNWYVSYSTTQILRLLSICFSLYFYIGLKVVMVFAIFFYIICAEFHNTLYGFCMIFDMIFVHKHIQNRSVFIKNGVFVMPAIKCVINLKGVVLLFVVFDMYFCWCVFV